MATSCDTSITLKEKYYNKEVINTLLQVDTNHVDYDNKNMLWGAEQTRLKQFFKGAKKTDNAMEKEVTYKVKEYKKITIGRLYPSNTKICFQNTWGLVRRLVSNGNHIGIDLENSQPKILLQCCLKYCQYHPINLSVYVGDRKRILQEICKHYNTDRDTAKNLILRLCYGGHYEKWAEDNDIVVSEHNNFIKNLYRELLEIRTDKIHKFPNFSETVKYYAVYEKKKEGKYKNTCALSIYLQDIERQIITVMLQSSEKYNLTPCSIIHDELLYDVNDNQMLLDNTEEVLNNLQKDVKESLGWNINLEAEIIKPTDDDLELYEKHKEFISDKYKEIIAEDSYDAVKDEFEKTQFKLIHSAEFGIETNDKIIVMKKSDFSIAFEEMTYSEIATDKEGNIFTRKLPFLKEWFSDKKKRSYNYVDFLPRPLKCPESVYNTWNGYPIEHIDVEPKCYNRILDLINILCNYEGESYEYVLDWLAQMMQTPAKKTGIAVIIKSKQGAGKGTLITICRKLMGTNYVGETANPQRDIFGNHGNIHINKILTSLDEAKNSDTNKTLGQLKNLITSDKCIYNEKGLKQVEITNCSRFIFTTNESIPISLDGKDDRRYCIIESSNKYCKNDSFWSDFYTNVVDDMGVIKGFYNFLMERDVSQREWMKIPQTEIRKDIIGTSLHPIVYFMERCVIKGNDFGFDGNLTISPTELYRKYQQYCTKRNISTPINNQSFGLIFKDNIPMDECGITKIKSHGCRKYLINRNKVFEWLKINDYTYYDELPDITDEIDYLNS